MSRPKPTPLNARDLFVRELSEMCDDSHELVRLTATIDWNKLRNLIAPKYAIKGRPGANTRLMIGLHILKHMRWLSDESVLAAWLENPYFQHFTGEQYFQHKLPIDRPTMTKFRKRLSEADLEALLAETLRIAIHTNAMPARHLERVAVDTNVQPKAITYPTDAKLLFKCIIKLNRFAKQWGVKPAQSYVCVAKRDVSAARAFHGRKSKYGRRFIKALRTKVGRLARDIERKIKGQIEAQAAFIDVADQVSQIMAQVLNRSHKPKLYSLHEPHVNVFSKGKAHKKYEFGNKVSIATPTKRSKAGQFVVGCQSLSGTPFDVHTLKDQIDQVKRLGGGNVNRVVADKGYKGHKGHKANTLSREVFISGARRGVTPQIRRELKRRQAVEPVIGHLKTDHRMERCHYTGKHGDMLNAMFAAIGYNFRLLARWLANFLAWIWVMMAQALDRKTSDNLTWAQ